MDIAFLPWNDKLAVLRFARDLWGPIISGHPVNHYIASAIYIADPTLLHNWQKLEKIIVKLLDNKKLIREENEILTRMLRFLPPRKYLEKVKEGYSNLQESFPKIKNTFEEVIAKLHGKEVLKEPVYVFPSFLLGQGVEGSAHGAKGVGIAYGIFGFEGEGTRVLVHELTHIYLDRDKALSGLLRELERKYALPFHEIHAEAITNLVWWRAGRVRKMFEQHYKEHWKELCDAEEEYWRIVKKWWNGPKSFKEYLLDKYSL